MSNADTLASYQSSKIVRAGEILEVGAAACHVLNEDGTKSIRYLEPGMTARYKPAPGDFWIIYSDNYQAISPRDAFLTGYTQITASIKDPLSQTLALCTCGTQNE